MIRQISPSARRFLHLVMLSLLVLIVQAASGQPNGQIEPPASDLSRTLNEATLAAYTCRFDPQTNAAHIRAGLGSADARPIPTDSYTITAQVGPDNVLLDPSLIHVQPLARRDPMRLVVVFDITDTMPLSEVVRAFSASFADELDPNDQVALITFGTDINPTTQFYTDKNRLVAENLLNLRLVPGDNRVYDATLEGVNTFASAEGADSERQAVVVITDSGRRNTQQVPSADIISRARALGVQVYTIGFFYEDAPDPDELINIADQTGGYGWVYNFERSRVAVGTAVGDYLNQLTRLLNSEIDLTIDLSGVQLPSDLSAGLPVTVTINATNERTLDATVNCPVRALSHSIRFTNIEDSDVLTVPINVTVATQSETDLTDSRVVFWLNDVIVRSTTDRFFQLDVPNLSPGDYSLRAELRDRNDQTLATTATIRIYVQQGIRLNTLDGRQADLAGQVQFQAIMNLAVTNQSVQFRIARQDDVNQAVPLAAGVADITSDGRALLTVDNIQAEVQRLFPDYSGNAYQVKALIPGNTPDVPLLAISEPLAITVSTDANAAVSGGTGSRAGTALGAAAGVGAIGAAATTTDLTSWLFSPFTLPAATIVGLFALNWLLFRQVGRSRVRRMIHVQDRHELSDRLMAVTMRRGGVVKTHPLTKKTVYIGRGSQNDINVGDDISISRQHGVVMWRKQDWYYANRTRRVVTRINGRRFRGLKLYRLEPITEIEIGSTHLYFHSNAQQDISELTKTNI
ncbi:MAG: VWA domain-containing protein [Anaerolineae bacterium]